jgi:hypothetical protein
MSNLVDNTIALKILYMLITPFVKMDAYKYGVIDDKGNILVSKNKLTSNQKQSFSLLDRIVISLKRLLAKLPGGDNQLKSFIAAYWLVKESYENSTEIDEQESLKFINQVIDESIILEQEEILVKNFLKEEGETASLANVTGEKVSTDIPLKPLFGKPKMFRRKINKEIMNGKTYRRISN